MERLNSEEKIILSDIRFKKSEEMLADAVKSLKNGMYMTSVNRSYYAALHAARSLLILKGVDPLSHDGVKTMISLHFIKPKILSQEVMRYFKNLMTLRTDVDYGDFESIEKNEVNGALKQAKRFLKIIDSVRKKLIKEISSR
jgi:uncharacterized protein (UPF0332 family)